MVIAGFGPLLPGWDNKAILAFTTVFNYNVSITSSLVVNVKNSYGQGLKSVHVRLGAKIEAQASEIENESEEGYEMNSLSTDFQLVLCRHFVDEARPGLPRVQVAKF